MIDPATPAQLFPGLFEAVARARLFSDSKLFADAVPRGPPAAILAAYAAEAPFSPDALRAFVTTHFTLPAGIGPAPAAAGEPLRRHIAACWDALARPPVAEQGSALAIRHRHVVPGGRFREPYYWDGYFTLLGLVRDRPTLAQAMIDMFVDLVERFGHVPNGARTYYVGRSQPPLFALMLDLVPARSAREAARRVDAALVEHRFWTSPPRAVRLEDGSVLTRYWDRQDGPREESWREDLETAATSDRPAPELWRDLRAAAESGWDFSSRWLGDDLDLAGIRTTSIVPVDLNGLLHAAERSLAARCHDLGRDTEAAALEGQAEARRAAVDAHCWQADEGRYGDYDLASHRITDRLSAATLFPLFAGMASAAQADAVARTTERLLLAPGGLRTTRVRSGQQWDAPNGWAPLQWIAIEGLRRYGHAALAARIAGAWLATVERHYARTGEMLEKYDVEEGLAAGGGEYEVQVGFGWTNGVCAVLLDARDDDPPPSRT